MSGSCSSVSQAVQRCLQAVQHHLVGPMPSAGLSSCCAWPAAASRELCSTFVRGCSVLQCADPRAQWGDAAAQVVRFWWMLVTGFSENCNLLHRRAGTRCVQVINTSRDKNQVQVIIMQCHVLDLNLCQNSFHSHNFLIEVTRIVILLWHNVSLLCIITAKIACCTNINYCILSMSSGANTGVLDVPLL